jgi:hypothetical protein
MDDGVGERLLGLGFVTIGIESARQVERKLGGVDLLLGHGVESFERFARAPDAFEGDGVIEAKAAHGRRELQRIGGGDERIFVALLSALDLAEQRPGFRAWLRLDIGLGLSFGLGVFAGRLQATRQINAHLPGLRHQRQSGAKNLDRFGIGAARLQHDAQIVVIAAIVQRIGDGAAQMTLGLIHLVLGLLDQAHEVEHRGVRAELAEDRRQHALGADRIAAIEQFATGERERGDIHARLHRAASNGA